MGNFCPEDSTYALPTHICTNPEKTKASKKCPLFFIYKAAMQLAILG